jgi:hypothetical protein
VDADIAGPCSRPGDAHLLKGETGKKAGVTGNVEVHCERRPWGCGEKAEGRAGTGTTALQGTASEPV